MSNLFMKLVFLDNDEIGDEEEDDGDANEFRFIIDDVLNHSDDMDHDDLFDETLIDGKWYCSFPGIIREILDVNIIFFHQAAHC